MTGIGQAYAAPPVEELNSEQVIAEGGVGGFNNYRIPAIMQLNNGDVLISYDGRPVGGDAPNPNSILQRRSMDGGATWGAQTFIHEGQKTAPKLGYSDPSYVYDEEENLLFNFHVFSKDQGFWGSALGNDDADRNVISAEVSKSADNGETWEHKLITNIVKPADVVSQFATSGHGIQIKSGDYAGRLVQQFAGRFVDGSVRAYSVYSDDHGETWTMGTPVGSKMDENKIVELSDGRLMMNSRQFGEGNARWISYSEDGGETWSTPKADSTLLDPRNNASIIRKNPNTFDGSIASKELLFSNANADSRTNGTVRYSCDDGLTWPVAKTFQTGATSYSDMVALQDGTFGLVYEGRNDVLRYGSFDDDWLKPFCVAFPDEKTVEATAGEITEMTVTVRNDDDRELPAGSATIEMGYGITAEPVEVPALTPGESADIVLKLNVPSSVPSVTLRGDVVLNAGDFRLRGDLVVKVSSPVNPRLSFIVEPKLMTPLRDIETNPYQAGDQLPYHFFVKSTSPVTTTVVPIEGDGFARFLPETRPNCRYMNLGANGQYTCDTAVYTISKEDIENGFARPVTRWAINASRYETETKTVIPDVVELMKRQPAIEVTRTAVLVDSEGKPIQTRSAKPMTRSAEPSKFVNVTVTVKNVGNVALNDIGDEGTRLLPSQSMSWSYQVPVTPEDEAAGEITIPEFKIKGLNGPDLFAEDTAEPLAVSVPKPKPIETETTTETTTESTTDGTTGGTTTSTSEAGSETGTSPSVTEPTSGNDVAQPTVKPTAKTTPEKKATELSKTGVDATALLAIMAGLGLAGTALVKLTSRRRDL
ncbi:MAG: sialidase family protein [Actinomycetaceae bacterium]|nr:sialidase family protein [Actinomycetaceae bacterium]